jgi:glycerophosphoryl diester phosphodiesterase
MRFTPQMRALPWLTATPIAHRGLHDRARGIIENSRSAFAAAIDRGLAIECDLQITADDEAVVFHDDRLDRVADGTGWIRSKPAAEICATRLKDSSDCPQTLAELLTQAGGRVPLVIELKSHWDGDERLARRALAVLERYEGPYCLMSFDPDVIETVRNLSPRTVRGIVADRTTDPGYHGLCHARRIEMQTLSHLPRTDPHFISFYFRDLPYTPVQRYRAEGHPLITWTIRSAAEAQAALAWSDQITFEGFLP